MPDFFLVASFKCLVYQGLSVLFSHDWSIKGLSALFSHDWSIKDIQPYLVVCNRIWCRVFHHDSTEIVDVLLEIGDLNLVLCPVVVHPVYE